MDMVVYDILAGVMRGNALAALLLVGVFADKRSFFIELSEVNVASVLVQTASIVAVRLTCTVQCRTTALQL